jgi:hypothetical protein
MQNKNMTTDEIFNTAKEIVAVIQKHTNHVPTALRIIIAAKQGLNYDPDCQPQSLGSERLHEAS